LWKYIFFAIVLYFVKIDTVNSLNGQSNVQFSLGFIFDGHAAYTDLRQNAESDLRDLATLYVFQDPVIQEFKESSGNEVLVSVVHSREGKTSVLTLYC